MKRCDLDLLSGIRHFLALKAGGQNKFSADEYRAAAKELYAFGWRQDQDRPEEPPPQVRHKEWIYPWWIDPKGGPPIRGTVNAMAFALKRYDEGKAPPPEPSQHAQRVVEALEQKPELLEEVQALLKEREL